jgi:hypothetical protein
MPCVPKAGDHRHRSFFRSDNVRKNGIKPSCVR